MILPTLAALSAGLSILIIVAWDVFSTVLHPWERTGPLSQRVIRWTWGTAMRGTRRATPARRHYLLALVGPALIPMIIALWALLVITGFALLYLPFMEEYFVRWDPRGPPATLGQAFSEAFFFSGYTFFTLGFGDLVPVRSSLRVVAITQSGAGFAFITFAIGYFLSVYDSYRRKNALAESIHLQSGGEGDPLRFVVAQLATASERAGLERSLAAIRDGLIQLRPSYANYPILLYMRDPRPEQSLLRTLHIVWEICGILDCQLDRSDCPELAGYAERSGLMGAARNVEDMLCRTLLRQVPAEMDGEKGLGENVVARFDRMREALGRVGIAVRDRDQALTMYSDLRRSWQPRLRAITEALGEDWKKVTGQG